jgi:hypothetical protein
MSGDENKLKLCVGAARYRSIGVREIRAQWWECYVLIHMRVHHPDQWTAHEAVLKENDLTKTICKDNLPRMARDRLIGNLRV